MLNNTEQAIYTSERVLEMMKLLIPSIEKTVKEVYDMEADSILKGVYMTHNVFVDLIVQYQHNIMSDMHLKHQA